MPRLPLLNFARVVALVRALIALLVATMFVGCSMPFPGSQSVMDGGTIVFGATIPITGEQAAEGSYTRDGYLMFIDTVNKAGGIRIGDKTYKLKLVYYDDGSQPERVAPLYERLITQDHVNFLLGPYSSQLTAAAVPIAEKYGVPMVAAHGSAESIFPSGDRYTFSIISPARNYLRGVLAVVLAKDPAIETVALLGADEPFAREVLAGAAEYAAERHLTVVYRSLYPLIPDDLSPLLHEIKQRNPDIVLAAGHLQDAILIVRQAKEQDLRPRALGFTSGPSTPEFRANLKGDADYIFGATQWTSALKYSGIGPWATPSDYAQAFRAAHPQYSEIPYQTAESTAALLVFQQAIEQSGTLDPEAVRTALSGLDTMTFYGRVKFDARGLNVYKPMAVEQLQPDGKKYTVFPADVAEREALYPMPAWTHR